MTHRVVLAALFATLLPCAGCADTKPAAKTPAVSDEPSFDYLFPKPGQRSDLACPAALPGVRVASIPTDSGLLLVFTTDSGLFEVRRRARKLAHELDQGSGMLGERVVEEGAKAAEPHRMNGIPTATRYEDIPEGATIEVTAIDPSDRVALREMLDRIVREMQRERDCPEELLALR